MRYLLDAYKQMVENGQIEGIQINVYKNSTNSHPQQDNDDLQIPTYEFITGCVYTVEMEDFEDIAIDALDHLNYFQIDTFEFKHYNNNELAIPVLKVNIIIRSDE